MQHISNSKRFIKQILYYINRYYSEKNIKDHTPIAGLSFDAIHLHVNVYGTYEKLELEVISEFLDKNMFPEGIIFFALIHNFCPLVIFEPSSLIM